jgi:hypothetical protein
MHRSDKKVPMEGCRDGRRGESGGLDKRVGYSLRIVESHAWETYNLMLLLNSLNNSFNSPNFQFYLTAQYDAFHF